jgi:uncharacterized protein
MKRGVPVSLVEAVPGTTHSLGGTAMTSAADSSTGIREVNMDKIQFIEQYVHEVMSNFRCPDLRLAHDYKHVDRVRRHALHLARQEGWSDLEIVEAAALLHDIGLAYVEQRSDHAEAGARRGAEFLREHNLFPEETICRIASAIRYHSSLSGGGALGELLRDADMLDIFGAVGLMRGMVSKYMKAEYEPGNVKGKTWGMSSQDFTERFQQGLGTGPTIIDQLNFQISCFDNLHTRTAHEIARPLVAFMRSYIEQLEREIEFGPQP